MTVGGLSDVTALAAAGSHTCALTQGGNVQCWGSNDLGALGDGTTDERTSPVVVTGLTDVTALATGWLHTCAVDRAGRVSCWGSNGSGQLANEDTDRASAVTVVS